MLPVVNKSECTGCGICVDDCPSGAISLDDAGISVIDQGACTECGACVSGCPAEAITES
ncbi:Ferredoxin-type protein NapF [Methanimicrococcus stummii]|uniref:Ferredoxin-type protein NapF n=1 Tax=Methanimicrococcus stummii TaxID=3028294 RepID=A0AA96VAB9_9EURY|nr:4Fe-4S binding protein [Methanimicrococcus sp. Es2]WNY28826.1 Ferredoxin-type protein NapF [Methanimicrococcus sp. Es2]